jgi:hypothetical protein
MIFSFLYGWYFCHAQSHAGIKKEEEAYKTVDPSVHYDLYNMILVVKAK